MPDAPAKTNNASSGGGNKQGAFKDKDKPTEIRMSNITAAKAVADAIRTSLGPKGMDKMIQSGNGDVTITNDGATILKQMQVLHPAARMLVELSKAQDIEAGDGTTTVVVIAGSLLSARIHPTTISESFEKAAAKALEMLTAMSTPVALSDRESLLKSAMTSLSSKVVSQYSNLLAPITVDAVLRVIDPSTADNVNLKDIRVVQKLGGTVDDTELIEGLILEQKISHLAGGISQVEKAKIGLIQFCISPPKTDMENQVVVSDYTQMDRVLREERQDAISDLALHFLNKMKILVVRDIERDEIEFICKVQ
ncbi:T-complex protein 1 subunit delta [Acropora cervicornis]|uniref:T-complex protein 1 subunit delta n=1 Tax=Acropora cervicornis TaxID=6130 RepID=A0AAD9QGW2_ACRCE|nr:T-complex protein 1 subunit delta [Acropora cervicornis]